MTKEDLRSALNDEQFQAACQIDGAFLILAGAGSGKTRVITYRTAYMLSQGISQSAILCLTFTNKAAREMEARVKSLTGRTLQNLTISTFHAFGVKLLRGHGPLQQEKTAITDDAGGFLSDKSIAGIEALGWRRNFSIYDEVDKVALIKECAKEVGLNTEALDLYKVSQLFSNIKTGRKSIEGEGELYKALYQSYLDALRLYNCVDFDDLIMTPIKLLRERPDIREKWQARYQYVMIDEFQDTSEKQYELIKLIAQKNIAVVGDDDQSIYSWRGANYKNITNFERDYNARTITLSHNYRSTKSILQVANSVIAHNSARKEKNLWTTKASDACVDVYLVNDERAEADFIAEAIMGICMERHYHYDEVGVLMRTNGQSRFIEEALLEANLPYTMSGGTSFFERKEIRDIISYLRVIANPDDDVNLLRIINTPPRAIGRATIEVLGGKAKEAGCSIFKAIKLLLSERGVCAQKSFEKVFANDEEGDEDGWEEGGEDNDEDSWGESSDENENSWGEGGESDDSDIRGSKSKTDNKRRLKESKDDCDFELISDGLFGARGGKASKSLTSLAAEALSDFVAFIGEWREKLTHGRGLAQKVRDLLEALDYKSFVMSENKKNEKAAAFKLKNVEYYLGTIESWEKDEGTSNPNLFSYLNRITLMARDNNEEALGCVNLMTIHASKGLEFKAVFIAGCEEGILPHKHSIEGDANEEELEAGGGESLEALEEERRLFYVAITRACEKLYISCCQSRTKRGGGVAANVECVPSRFLDEIPANLVKIHAG